MPGTLELGAVCCVAHITVGVAKQGAEIDLVVSLQMHSCLRKLMHAAETHGECPRSEEQNNLGVAAEFDGARFRTLEFYG